MKNITWRTVRTRYRYSLILLRELVRTDFKVRYQGSALGYLWSLLRPLFMFVILYFIFVYFLKIGNGIPHWPVALLFGMVIWNFFSEITNQGLGSVVAKGDVIRKINFPKYIIVISVSISALINLFFNLVVVAVFMAINRLSPSWDWFMIIPIIIEVYLVALGCAFVLSTMFVKFRDINFIWDIVMQGAFYGSAVLFPISEIAKSSPLAAKVLLLNPVAQAMQDARHFLLPHDLPTANFYIHHALINFIPFAIILVVLVFGAAYFRRRSPFFAEDI